VERPRKDDGWIPQWTDRHRRSARTRHRLVISEYLLS
jgi:hypothetical protein